jgi:hypothetical protein
MHYAPRVLIRAAFPRTRPTYGCVPVYILYASHVRTRADFPRTVLRRGAGSRHILYSIHLVCVPTPLFAVHLATVSQ